MARMRRGASELSEWRIWMQAAELSARTIDERVKTVTQFTHAHGDPARAGWQQLAAFLATPGWAADTRYTRYSQLHAFYRWLTLTGQRDDDPMGQLQKPKKHRGLPRPASPTEVAHVLAACQRRRTRMMVVLAICQGLRVHEIAKFRGEDLGGGHVHVLGKGAVDASLPAHPLLVTEAGGWPARGWWFPSPTNPRRPVTAKGVSRTLSDAFTRAGVPGSAHNLRHFYGTQTLRSSGGNLRVTQELMRHASPATTAIYTKVDDEQMRAAVDALPIPFLRAG
jgi:integrase/recombinase XerD